jgi:AcrR family transcriptional regulator
VARDHGSDERHDGHVDLHLGEQLRELVVSKLAEKAASKKRDSAKSKLQAEALELIGERISSLDLWTRMPPGERRTRVTRDELAVAAVRIADTEGLPALSMRRLATDVGVGTMTLYHYVRNKDELLTLVVDAVMGEVVVPDTEELPGGWRDALVAIANRTRAAFARHPWILDIADDPQFGPNSVRHFDQTLQAVSSIDLPLADRLDVASLIDEFVFGFALYERNNADTRAEPEAKIVEYVTVLLATGAYPTMASIVDELGIDGLWETIRASHSAPDRFHRHLDRLLDGIAADLTARGREIDGS